MVSSYTIGNPKFGREIKKVNPSKTSFQVTKNVDGKEIVINRTIEKTDDGTKVTDVSRQENVVNQEINQPTNNNVSEVVTSKVVEVSKPSGGLKGFYSDVTSNVATELALKRGEEKFKVERLAEQNRQDVLKVNSYVVSQRPRSLKESSIPENVNVNPIIVPVMDEGKVISKANLSPTQSLFIQGEIARQNLGLNRDDMLLNARDVGLFVGSNVAIGGYRFGEGLFQFVSDPVKGLADTGEFGFRLVTNPVKVSEEIKESFYENPIAGITELGLNFLVPEKVPKVSKVVTSSYKDFVGGKILSRAELNDLQSLPFSVAGFDEKGRVIFNDLSPDVFKKKDFVYVGDKVVNDFQLDITGKPVSPKVLEDVSLPYIEKKRSVFGEVMPEEVSRLSDLTFLNERIDTSFFGEEYVRVIDFTGKKNVKRSVSLKSLPDYLSTETGSVVIGKKKFVSETGFDIKTNVVPEFFKESIPVETRSVNQLSLTAFDVPDTTIVIKQPKPKSPVSPLYLEVVPGSSFAFEKLNDLYSDLKPKFDRFNRVEPSFNDFTPDINLKPRIPFELGLFSQGKQNLKQYPSLVFRDVSILNSQQGLNNVNILKNSLIIDTGLDLTNEYTLSSRSRLKTDTLLKTDQLLKTDTLLDLKFDNPLQSKSRQRNTRKIRDRFETSNFNFKLNNKNVDKSLFSVFVKRRGKFKKVGIAQNPFDAFNIGKEITGKTASASFFVENDFGVKVKDFNLDNKFRESKRSKGVFVEKSRFRIDTPTELQQITRLGVRRNRL